MADAHASSRSAKRPSKAEVEVEVRYLTTHEQRNRLYALQKRLEHHAFLYTLFLAELQLQILQIWTVVAADDRNPLFFLVKLPSLQV
ncbi:hypothetical protein HL42_7240 [Trichophyton rubrum]|nr:hypothetical protein HL42_7240 [Trichophyton rubrum]